MIRPFFFLFQLSSSFAISQGIPTFYSLFRAFHENSSRTRMQRRIGVPVFRLAFTDMLQIIYADPALRQVFLQIARGTLRPYLLASDLRARVHAAAILVPHVAMKNFNFSLFRSSSSRTHKSLVNNAYGGIRPRIITIIIIEIGDAYVRLERRINSLATSHLVV